MIREAVSFRLFFVLRSNLKVCARCMIARQATVGALLPGYSYMTYLFPRNLEYNLNVLLIFQPKSTWYVCTLEY